MESIVFFGKGGIGKSTISSNVSIALAKRGHSVLHLGCDPKMDSALALTGRTIIPFSKAGVTPGKTDIIDLITQSPHIANVHCAEAGGPEPGIGCAGAAISGMLDSIRLAGILEDGTYSRIVFDVLGDVVCGGFAAPLKKGFAKKAIIISSEEILSLYAANNLLKMLGNFSRNGVYAAGIVLNVRDPNGVEMARKYAHAVKIPILGEIPRDRCVYEASKKRIPALLHSPDSVFSKKITELAESIEKSTIPEEFPSPLAENDFSMFASGFDEKHWNNPSSKIVQENVLTLEKLKKHGIVPLGIKDRELRFRYETNGKTLIFALTTRSEADPSMLLCSDWGAYMPRDSSVQEIPKDLVKKLGYLSNFRYRDFVRIFVKGISPREAIFAITGKPMDISHGLPVPFDDTPKFYKYSFMVAESKLPRISCFLVDYADIECRFNGGTYGGSLCRYSSRNTKGIPQPYLPNAVLPFINSNCRREDLLLGNGKKLARDLSAACESIKENGSRVLELDIGCSPLLIYQDIDNVVSKIEKKYDVSIGVENIHGVMDPEEKEYPEKLCLYAKAISKWADKPECHVCLTGFQPFSAVLEKMLEEKGIEAKSQGTFDSVTEFVNSALYVFYYSGTLTERFILNQGRKTLSGIRPFGLEGTKNWLKRISESLRENGIKTKKKQYDIEPSDYLISHWEELNRMLEGTRIAFIITGKDADDILKNGQDFPAINMISFLNQTSMEMVFLVKDVSNPPLRLFSKFNLKKHSFFPFESENEILNILENIPNLKMVYSDLRDDERIVCAGKIPFSSDLLEPGYEGAVETLRRIAELQGI